MADLALERPDGRGSCSVLLWGNMFMKRVGRSFAVVASVIVTVACTNASAVQGVAAVGSNSNIAENGMDQDDGRAAIWEIDIATGLSRVFATGLRNPVGMAWEPVTGMLWTSVNERDELGHDLVPDYITSVRDGGFYGWPYSYYGQHVDERVTPAPSSWPWSPVGLAANWSIGSINE